MRPIAEAFAFGGLDSAPLRAFADAPARRILLRGERSAGRGLARLRLFLLSAPQGLGLVLTIGFLAGVAYLGVVRGGEYQAFIEREGDLRDVVARALGFDIAIVTISGQAELREREILAAAHITPKNSLLFLDAADARKGLEALPLVKSASVRKLYPNHLVIELVERAPYALWQKDGKVSIVAADGAAMDQMTDDRFIGLPFVVGEGANERLPEFAALLERAGELRPKIKAGMLVSGRRWDLAMTNGMVVKLPEVDPLGAMAILVRLQREHRVLDRAALSLDLRVDGKMFVRLTEEAAAARAAAARPAKKGAT